MKGIVFTEFLEMVEDQHGYELVDKIICDSNLPSQGIYTAIGTYNHQELVQLITQLSVNTSTPIPHLLRSFGHYLFGTFQRVYPSFFESAGSAFELLESIENHIHVEVKKLYPDAELPTFKTQLLDSNTLEMIYISDRHMSDFALGLIEKTMEHYQEAASITMEATPGKTNSVTFIISRP